MQEIENAFQRVNKEALKNEFRSEVDPENAGSRIKAIRNNMDYARFSHPERAIAPYITPENLATEESVNLEDNTPTVLRETIYFSLEDSTVMDEWFRNTPHMYFTFEYVPVPSDSKKLKIRELQTEK